MTASRPCQSVEPSNLGSKPSPFAATSKAEASKHMKYDAPVATMNPPLTFVAIAFNDFGGIGLEFYTTVVNLKPYFHGTVTGGLGASCQWRL